MTKPPLIISQIESYMIREAARNLRSAYQLDVIVRCTKSNSEVNLSNVFADEDGVASAAAEELCTRIAFYIEGEIREYMHSAAELHTKSST